MMIFQRSKTVTVEVMARVWRFNRPPGSVVLGWAPRVAELSRAADQVDRVFPIDVDEYRSMVEELAEWVRDIDGESADDLTAADLDAGMIASEGLQVWIAFFTELNASAADVKKSATPSGSDSPRTTTAGRSTTAEGAGKDGLRH